MRHLVFLALKKDESVPQTAEGIRKILANLPKRLPGAGNPRVLCNCVVREDNLDIMIEIPLDSRRELQQWIDHEAHQELIAYAAPKVTGKYTIDLED